LTFGFDYQTAEKNILNDSLFFGTRTIGTFRLEKKNYGYYIHNEITIADKIHLSGGYRYDKADFFFRPSSPDHTDMDEDLYTAGINYHFYGKSYAYFSFSKSYRYPLLDELFSFFTSTINTSLIPQFSNDYELGIRYYLTDTVYAHVNLFRIKTENEIFYNAAAFANENLDGTSRRHGIECSLGARIFPWLTFNGSYTYMDAKIQEGSFEDKDIPNIPHDKVTLETIASPVKGFSISLIGAYIGERPFISDFSNTFGKQEDYIVINGKVKYQWKFLTAFLDINNITDEEYAEYGVLGGFPLERAFYPSPKRNFLAGLSVEF
jgi:outer membrane receptor protein involved in Fe transport